MAHGRREQAGCAARDADVVDRDPSPRLSPGSLRSVPSRCRWSTHAAHAALVAETATPPPQPALTSALAAHTGPHRDWKGAHVPAVCSMRTSTYGVPRRRPPLCPAPPSFCCTLARVLSVRLRLRSLWDSRLRPGRPLPRLAAVSSYSRTTGHYR
ncbi:hypothetical protein K466DRAFT_592673 [Polyporus arcularius HHB13444]|uniref:Uncharacterized protein n=1 Tax=Polyporus arcularius HHB13444 TaxID=1314778 RepID=A0A5C3NPB9_9APHY|nr:hypothetical protein K466DRAFT_592673 [Polyporus arcularius HHB13444]